MHHQADQSDGIDQLGQQLPGSMSWLRLGGDPAVGRHSAISGQQHRLVIELAELFDLLFLSLPNRWPDIAVRRPTAMNTSELLTFSSVVVVVVVLLLALIVRRCCLAKLET